jgi:hypothetical protein
MLEQLKDYWLKSENYRISVLSMLCAAAIALLPLQKYMTLSRFQKYGMAIFAFGVGYFIQLAWSWRKLKKWARASSCATAMFFASVGVTFYENPWLDTNVSVQTDDRLHFRYLLLGGYFVFALIIGFIWFKWIAEDSKNKPAGTEGDGSSGSSGSTDGNGSKG